MTQPYTTENQTEYPVVELLSEFNRNPEGKHYLHLRHAYLINNSNTGMTTSVGIDLLEEDFNNETLGYEHKTSNISRIWINPAVTKTIHFFRLLSSCKTLREFQYTTGGRGIFDEGDFSFNPKALMKRLCEHRETPEILDIDNDACVLFQGQLLGAEIRIYKTQRTRKTMNVINVNSSSDSLNKKECSKTL
ncbi:hypothetical protein N7508_006765 [Penicillium antarcticum]|uniref:uncharacterized protein n=1 Tax=Penicillium antarcticum TaxID=416450 RepID=UPI002395048D|nr:uncharacterized protein N7508_006765 [Penicillium antarcticum]KAJ5301902.1 hypothetical protein N7508_006765 [Penicillium antarcticum]